jgi:hypothetical protein
MAAQRPRCNQAILAATNKFLAKNNKSRTGGKATKKRDVRQPTLVRYVPDETDN